MKNKIMAEYIWMDGKKPTANFDPAKYGWPDDIIKMQ